MGVDGREGSLGVGGRDDCLGVGGRDDCLGEGARGVSLGEGTRGAGDARVLDGGRGGGDAVSAGDEGNSGDVGISGDPCGSGEDGGGGDGGVVERSIGCEAAGGGSGGVVERSMDDSMDSGEPMVRCSRASSFVAGRRCGLLRLSSTGDAFGVSSAGGKTVLSVGVFSSSTTRGVALSSASLPGSKVSNRTTLKEPQKARTRR